MPEGTPTHEKEQSPKLFDPSLLAPVSAQTEYASAPATPHDSPDDRSQLDLPKPTSNVVQDHTSADPAIASYDACSPQQFQALLTLFSKFFSSFPHGTCSLSVSRPYLVLEEIYLPLRAALPSNPTLRYNMTTADNPPVRTGLSPSQGSHSKEFKPGAQRTSYP